ncbi:hypothetical protein MNV49_002300 [Pseudohyphozyma bogoriensis]|nr:hypothetical protein MNV49_002300 [Pseudohyphozyma bogoriensis]
MIGDETPKMSRVDQGTKKRKVEAITNDSEPKSQEAWLDLAIERYEVAREWWMSIGGGEWAELEYERGIKWVEDAFTELKYAHASMGGWLSMRTDGDCSYEGYEERWGPLVPVALSAISTLVTVLETYPAALDTKALDGVLENLEEGDYLLVKPVGEAAPIGDEENGDHKDEAFVSSPEYQERVLEVELVKGDIKLLLFVEEERKIEEKYRPEEEGKEEEEDDVVPLPKAEDVKQAKKNGLKVIGTLQKTIGLLAASPSSSTTKAQYAKLEEAYLLYSALINPSDEKEIKRVEDEVERVREEGRLNEAN